MVLRVCRSILRDEHEAHDAFQATFLVLIRRASALWTRDTLGPWLHQVAWRVAHCARLGAARRARHLRSIAALASQATSDDDAAPEERHRILHEELGRLHERDRAVIVLCCLEGLSQRQAADRLGWPLGTVQSRLARGRERLAARLTRRGLAPAVATALVARASEGAVESIPAALEAATIHAADALIAGGTAAAGTVPAAVARLMEGVLRSMLLNSLKRIAVVLVALGAVVAGAGVLARQQPEATPKAPPSGVAADARTGHIVEPPDTIQVEVEEALPGKPITGERLVRPDGTISLNYYGELHVAGQTTAQIKESVITHLRKYLSDTQLGLIAPDPDHPGRSRAVAAADSLRVYVDVMAYNSKNYYVLGSVAAPGRLPVTGNDTVLDAINYAGGMIPTQSRPQIRLVRPAVPGISGAKVLEVDYAAIVYEGDTTTNYRLQPGDRVIVLRDLGAEENQADPATILPTNVIPTPRVEAARPDPALARRHAGHAAGHAPGRLRTATVVGRRHQNGGCMFANQPSASGTPIV
jgi:RNA polymerase sigma factor (sigma-70 family)